LDRINPPKSPINNSITKSNTGFHQNKNTVSLKDARNNSNRDNNSITNSVSNASNSSNSRRISNTENNTSNSQNSSLNNNQTNLRAVPYNTNPLRTNANGDAGLIYNPNIVATNQPYKA